MPPWTPPARPSIRRCSKTRASRGSRGVLINITGSSRLGLHEVNEACSIIREAADCDDVQINFGVTMNESMADAVKITVIATGFQPQYAPAAEQPPAPPQVIWSEPAWSRPRQPNRSRRQW